MTLGAMNGRKIWVLVRHGREIDHRDVEKRRDERASGEYREEVSASAMEPVCPVGR